jgi:hypothetical protein
MAPPAPQTIDVVEAPHLFKALLFAVGGACWSGLTLLAGSGTRDRLVLLLVGAVLLPLLTLGWLRAMRRRRRTLVRATGRLLLDGEPVELARVELRVREWPIIKRPAGYRLSLWVMTSSGPEDILLGEHRTLMKASGAAGVLEDFLQRANVKQPGRTGV